MSEALRRVYEEEGLLKYYFDKDVPRDLFRGQSATEAKKGLPILYPNPAPWWPCFVCGWTALCEHREPEIVQWMHAAPSLAHWLGNVEWSYVGSQSLGSSECLLVREELLLQENESVRHPTVDC